MTAVHPLPPLSLYIHLPWCVSKCPYCDFNSHLAVGMSEARYCDNLISDLQCDLHYVQTRRLNSIFIGGGTPSLFSASAIANLLERIASYIPLAYNCEITLEANPESATLERLVAYRDAGINRLSLGVQSCDDQQLKQLGRAHDAQQAFRAFDHARRAGFDNINCDLMFGLAQQTQAQAVNDIEQIAALAPEHISWYQLTLEPNTVFYSHPPTLPDDDTVWRMQCAGIALLEQLGYRRYEVSAYTRHEPCYHNLNYWCFGDYLGIGAGAHGKVTLAVPYQVIRTRKHRMPQSYMAGQFCLERREIASSDLLFEFLLNALRLPEGIEIALFSRIGLDYQRVKQQLSPFIDKSWLQLSTERLKPTATGLQFLNEMLEYYLPNPQNPLVYAQIPN